MLARSIRILAMLALVNTVACGKEGPGGPAPSLVTVTLAGETFRPGDVLTVTATGLDVSEDEVSATLAGSGIDLVRLGDSAFAAFVPELAPGAVTLTVPFADTTASFPLTIQAALVIADPAATIDSILDSYRAILTDVPLEGIDSATWVAETELLDSLLVAAKADVAELTAEERVTLARLLVSSAPDLGTAPALVAAAADTLCALKEKGVLEQAGLAGRALGAGLLALPVGLFSEKLGDQLMTAARASFRRLVVAEYDRTKNCRVPTKLTMSFTGVRGAPPAVGGPALSAAAAGPHRFFKGYTMRFAFTGEFRPVSRDDLASDALLATVDGAYRGVLGLAKDNLAKLPTWVPGEIALLPPAVADRPSAPGTPGELLPGDLQIAAVSPASVSLTPGVDGEFLTLTSNNTVTADVPFTFEVVNKTKPTVRLPMAGVLRPMMTATWEEIGHTFQGDRTTEVIGGVTYGKLSCGGSLNLKVKGGDEGRWEEFHWLQVGPGEQEESDTVSLGGAIFQEGDHPFSGNWYWRNNVGGTPTYSPFTVYFRVKYTDLVSNEVKETPIYSFTCN